MSWLLWWGAAVMSGLFSHSTHISCFPLHWDMVDYSIPKYVSEVFRNGMDFFLRNQVFIMLAFAFSLGMEVQAASLWNKGLLHSLWLMYQVFISFPFTSAIVNEENNLLGIHQVVIDFCNCHINGIVPHHIQILWATPFSQHLLDNRASGK